MTTRKRTTPKTLAATINPMTKPDPIYAMVCNAQGRAYGYPPSDPPRYYGRDDWAEFARTSTESEITAALEPLEPWVPWTEREVEPTVAALRGKRIVDVPAAVLAAEKPHDGHGYQMRCPECGSYAKHAKGCTRRYGSVL